MSRPQFTRQQQQKIAVERIEQLFKEAELVFSESKPLADRYISLARKIAMKVKAKIPLKYKRRYCKHCYSYLRPGKNCRVRTSKGKVIISCFECKKFTRIPIK